MKIMIKCPHCGKFFEVDFSDKVKCKWCEKEFALVDGKQYALADWG